MLFKEEWKELSCLPAQPLLESVMPILDPFKDDNKRSEGFFVNGSWML